MLDKEAGEATLEQLQHSDGETRTNPMPAASAAVEQRTPGHRTPAQVVESFDGLGVGFKDSRERPTFAILQTTALLSVLITSSKQ